MRYTFLKLVEMKEPNLKMYKIISMNRFLMRILMAHQF